MKKYIFPCLLFACLTFVNGAVYEIDFNKFPVPGNWSLPKGFSYDRTGGESGSGALRYQRSIEDRYVIARHRITVKPGARYRLSVMVRGEKLKNLRGLIAVEYKYKGKHVTGNYYRGSKKLALVPDEWKKVTLNVSPPKKFDVASIAIYLGRTTSGTVWYDNLRLEEVGKVPPDIFDLPPSNLTIRGKQAELSFKAVTYQPVAQKSLAMKITADGKTQTVKADASGFFSVHLNKMKPGRLAVTTELLNIQDNKVIGQAKFNYFVTTKLPGANASMIDRNGLATVDGKAFLPIGFYHGGRIRKPMLKRLSEAGVNFLMPYSIGKEKDIPGILDLAWKYKLKVLFNVMYQHKGKKSKITRYRDAKGIDAVLKTWVKEFRSHPALLGWYLSDENPRQELPRVRQMREMINAIDPDHFTVSLTYRTLDFAAFISTGDIFATDQYPIETANSQSMNNIVRMMSAASDLTPRVWMVPQAFSWGSVRKNYPKNPYRFPTDQEIRSMVLSGAVNGAKGYLFFSHSAIFVAGEKREPGSAEKNWRQVIPTIKLLRELSPLFLSTEVPPKIKVNGSKTQARAWTKNDKTIVVVTGNGPGENSALITVPGYDKLKSRYGFTKNLGGGKYQFNAKNISSDILE